MLCPYFIMRYKWLAINSLPLDRNSREVGTNTALKFTSMKNAGHYWVEVGRSVFQRYRSAKEIGEELAIKNVFLSDSEVYFLTKKFLTYLGMAHRQSGPGIREHMRENGGYILHIDGTCDGGSPHLIAVIDAISGFVLDSIKIPTENSDQIIPMLKSLKEIYGIPCLYFNQTISVFAWEKSQVKTLIV